MLWSRQGTDLTDRFPRPRSGPCRRAASSTVLVMLDNGRLSFDQLQRRLVTSPARARQLAGRAPASYMAFDLLAAASIDIRSQSWTTRRGRLESLAAWAPPLQLSPVTYDVAEAREWFDVLPDALGIEGLVVKGTASMYAPGRREW